MQNSVDYQDLGVATSGATFFRSIGGSFGTAVFGAVFVAVLPGDLAVALHGAALPAGITAATGASPATLGALPAAVKVGFIGGYADALHTVFLDTIHDADPPARQHVALRGQIDDVGADRGPPGEPGLDRVPVR